MKKLFALSVVLSLVLVPFVSSGVFASSSATVTSTVTIQNISVSVSSGTVSWGTLATNTTLTTLASPGLADTQTVTNNGNVAEDFAIVGGNSTDWTLAGTAGSNTYVQKFCPSSCGTNASPTNFTALTTSNQTLASNIAAAGTANLDLLLTTPTSSTVTTAETLPVTILATLH